MDRVWRGIHPTVDGIADDNDTIEESELKTEDEINAENVNTDQFIHESTKMKNVVSLLTLWQR